MDGQKPTTDAPVDGGTQPPPGTTVAPGSASNAFSATQAQTTTQPQFTSTPAQEITQPKQEMPPQSSPQNEGFATWANHGAQANPEDNRYESERARGETIIRWTASEYVAHHKAASWYLLLGLAAVGLATLIWLVTKDTISAVVVLVAATIFGSYGARQPRQLTYTLGRHGLAIENKYYGYHQFRSFAVVPDGAFASIAFMPMKRFAPLITIYYAPDDEDRIIDLLADYLPMEEGRRDLFDQFMNRIRF